MSYVTSPENLPLSTDLQITVNMAQTLARQDLTILCVACEGIGFLPDARRIRFYSTLSAVANDFASNSEPYKAAQAFFSQSPHPAMMAVGQVWFDAIAASLVSGVEFSAADIAALKLVTNGSMTLVYNDDIAGSGSATAVNLTAINFSSISTIADIRTVLNGKLPSGLVASIVTLPGGEELLSISTVSTGDDVVISYPTSYSSGTYVGELLLLSAAKGGTVLNGYTPTDIAGELDNLSQAANANGKFIYGWAFGASLREVSEQTIAAGWALAQQYAIMGLVSNDPNAPGNPAYLLDIGPVVSSLDNKRCFTCYHDNVSMYPEISILAYMLSVDYQVQNSTVTAKFKPLPGISTVPLTETEWGVLKQKGYNTYTLTGIDALVFREGTTGSSGWFIDTTINMDNFIADLSTNVYNVFLRNKKVPFSKGGQAKLVDAMQDTGNQYIYNGTFAPRQVENTSKKSGYSILPAVIVNPTPISQSTAAQRAGRIGPPCSMTCQEAGAIHSISIAVDLVQ